MRTLQKMWLQIQPLVRYCMASKARSYNDSYKTPRSIYQIIKSKTPSSKFVDGVFFHSDITKYGNAHKRKIIIYDNFDLFKFIQLLFKEHPAAFRRFRIHPQVFN